MKVAALISGGKDSCYNMMTCIAEGHDITALANLRPEHKDELDSYMYQTVGHHAIDLYADAMDLPLYVRTIKGSSLSIGRDYQPQEGDEVEDLFQLLSQIKSERDIDAVSVGAIMSDYQRVRVENVCQRLGLRVLAFLWRRPQEELLREMIDSGLKAIIIKVAAMGLLPDKHLGMELKDILPHMIQMRKKYGLNECGEGGEYETFVFDCPLFKKSILIEEKEQVIHSDDAFAPVGYLNLKKCSLQEKPGHDVSHFLKELNKYPITTTTKWLAKQFAHDEDDIDDNSNAVVNDEQQVNKLQLLSAEQNIDHLPSYASDGNHFQVSGIRATTDSTSDVFQSTTMAMDSLKERIEKMGFEISDVTSLSLYVGSMSNYSAINSVYKMFFQANPPTRICIQVCLAPTDIFQMDCEGCKSNRDMDDRKTMYVQSLSLWAPANLGPFSQSILLSEKIYASGTTALVPSTLKLIDGGIKVQSRVAFQHLMQKFIGLWPRAVVGNLPLINCYVTKTEHIRAVKREFDLILQENTDRVQGFTPRVQYCVVPRLPQGALVEWQAYAWTCASLEEEHDDDDDDTIVATKSMKDFDQWSLELDCVLFREHISCRIEICSDSTNVIDTQELARGLLLEYIKVMDKRSRKEGVQGGLAKIYYQVDKFSYTELVQNFSEALPEVDRAKIPILSFIPVISLDTERHLLSWCQ